MDQYQLANAAEKIDGYFDPHPHDVVDRQLRAFDRAKAECVSHLQAQLDAVKAISVEQFMTATKRSKLFAAESATSQQRAA